ncbi:MAG: AmmeMemoRadiSam system protein B [Campylobacterota bacterium]|nr:AmmeMemoRadiSam system protein B [Campylobacterota bacterium]
MKNERKLAVSGQFYPDEAQELEKYVQHFNSVLEQHDITIDEDIQIKAIIVPHAGYIYSGFTANLAYRYIPSDVKNIIVIGPSHKFAFEGASVAMYDSYPTPFGDLEINQELNGELFSKYDFLGFSDEVHCEHSTETQFPFIKYYTEDTKVIEIVYSDCNFKDIAKIIYDLMQDKDNFIVISTDLSHFYNINEANIKDNICLNAISNIDVEELDSGCEACGKVGVKALLSVVNELDLDTKVLDYRTSADTSNDENSVVGYVSAIVFR